MGASSSNSNNSRSFQGLTDPSTYNILVIRTKDSQGYKFVGNDKECGFYYNKRYVHFDAGNHKIIIGLSIWDTPAIDTNINIHHYITNQYYDYCHGLFCVYNINSISSFQAICKHIQFLKNPQRTPFLKKSLDKISFILVGHKLSQETNVKREISYEFASMYAKKFDLLYFEVSSDNYADMSDLYTVMAQQIYFINKDQRKHETWVANDVVITKPGPPKPENIEKLEPKPKHNNSNTNQIIFTTSDQLNDVSPSPMPGNARLSTEFFQDTISPEHSPGLLDQVPHLPAPTYTDSEMDKPVEFSNGSKGDSSSISDLSDLEDTGDHSDEEKRYDYEQMPKAKLTSSNTRPSVDSNSNVYNPNWKLSHQSELAGMIPDECMLSDCQLEFKKFCDNRVQLSFLYQRFCERAYNDIRMLKHFDEDMLQNEIKIENRIHRKLFFQQCELFKQENEEFIDWLTNEVQLKQYQTLFEQKGILTLQQFNNLNLESEHEFQLKFQIPNSKHCHRLWRGFEKLFFHDVGLDDTTPAPNQRSSSVSSEAKEEQEMDNLSVSDLSCMSPIVFNKRAQTPRLSDLRRGSESKIWRWKIREGRGPRRKASDDSGMYSHNHRRRDQRSQSVVYVNFDENAVRNRRQRQKQRMLKLRLDVKNNKMRVASTPGVDTPKVRKRKRKFSLGMLDDAQNQMPAKTGNGIHVEHIMD